MSKKNVLYSNLDSSCIKLICSKLLNTDDSQRAIARQANVSARTVRRFAERLKKHGITKYSEIAELTPLEVYKKLYERKVSTLVLKSDNDKFIPDFGKIVVEMIENRHQSIKKRYEDYCAQAESLGKIPLCLSYFSAKIKQERDKLAKESPEFYYAQSYPYGLYAELDFTGDQYELYIQVTFDTSQLLSGWLKRFASQNMSAIFQTFETSQLPIGWLKFFASRNIQYILSTFDTFHSFNGWLKFSAS